MITYKSTNESTKTEETTAEKNKRIYGTPLIRIIGVGGAGGHTLSRLKGLKKESFRSYDTISINTDKQDLFTSSTDIKIQIGENITEGKGAGANPDVGRKCAEANSAEIAKVIEKTDILFIIAGMGGGTGTGAAPVVAQIAKKMNILTISIPIYPEANEGYEKSRLADAGIDELRKNSDGVVVVSNDRVQSENGSIRDYYSNVDSVIYGIINCIADIIIYPGERNFDPADLAKVVKDSRNLHIGSGTSTGKGAIFEATQKAMYNKAIMSGINGANLILFNIKAKIENLIKTEYDDVLRMVKSFLSEDSLVINGFKTCPEYNDKVEIEIVASNYDEESVMKIFGEDIKPKQTEIIRPTVIATPVEEDVVSEEQPEEEVNKIPDFMSGIKIDW